jgi:hypothetical protein
MMGEMINRIHFQAKKTSTDLGTYFFRVMTGGWIGMVFAHLFQLTFKFENLLFTFIIVLVTGIVVRLTKGWGFFSIVILNLFCVLIGILLRMYLTISPGA